MAISLLLRPGSCRKNLRALGWVGVQDSVAQDEAILVRVDKPFLLNFGRNRL